MCEKNAIWPTYVFEMNIPPEWNLNGLLASKEHFLQKENFNVLDRSSERMVGRWVLVSRPSRPKMSAKEYAFVKCDVTRDCSYIEICLSSKPTGLHDSAQMKFSQILHALKTWPTITKGWRKSWNWNTIVPDSSPFVSISSMFVFKGLILSKSCFLFLTQ